MKVERYYPSRDTTRYFDLDDPKDIVRFIARERYALGGYEICGITDDGAILCSQCIKDNYRSILTDIRDGYKWSGWHVASWLLTSDVEESAPCDNCYKELCPYLDTEE